MEDSIGVNRSFRVALAAALLDAEVRKFDQHDIPYDVLWLDIEHTDSTLT